LRQAQANARLSLYFSKSSAADSKKAGGSRSDAPLAARRERQKICWFSRQLGYEPNPPQEQTTVELFNSCNKNHFKYQAHI
jgi:hypothetical protein